MTLLAQVLQTPQPDQAHWQRPPRRGAGAAVSQRAVRAQGRETVRKLLAAGLAEFAERGFQAATVDDIVRRASIAHGTFYLYFINKDDLFGVLARDALGAMEVIGSEFPVVTPSEGGKTALRKWVVDFCDTYTTHSTVLRILSQGDLVGRSAWAIGLHALLGLADAIALGMTAGLNGASSGGEIVPARRARLAAVACLMMLERVNYLLSAGVQLPRTEMEERLTDIIFTAFPPGEALSAANVSAHPVQIALNG